MSYILQILSNHILQTAVISWFAAQGLKVISTLVSEHKLNLKRFFGSGGMPSSHSSFTVSIAVEVGFATSFAGVEFAIAAALAVIVMYDASGVRRNAGEQATALNKLISKSNLKSEIKALKESLGHTPLQVFAGATLGVVIAILRNI